MYIFVHVWFCVSRCVFVSVLVRLWMWYFACLCVCLGFFFVCRCVWVSVSVCDRIFLYICDYACLCLSPFVCFCVCVFRWLCAFVCGLDLLMCFCSEAAWSQFVDQLMSGWQIVFPSPAGDRTLFAQLCLCRANVVVCSLQHTRVCLPADVFSSAAPSGHLRQMFTEILAPPCNLLPGRVVSPPSGGPCQSCRSTAKLGCWDNPPFEPQFIQELTSQLVCSWRPNQIYMLMLRLLQDVVFFLFFG